MKFSKLFNTYKDEQSASVNYVRITEVYDFLRKTDEKVNKNNLKRALHAFQRGAKTINGKESATVQAVLKYFFHHSNSSRSCHDVICNIERELFLNDKTSIQSSLKLYKLIAKANIQNFTSLLDQTNIDETRIATLIVEHKVHFESFEWKTICWFENDFSKAIEIKQKELSYEDVLELKYTRFQSILSLCEGANKWVQAADEQIRTKNIRYQAGEKDGQIEISSGLVHVASVLDSDIKSVLDIYCPNSVGHVVNFDVKHSRNSNCVWVVFFQLSDLEADFNDVCSRVFFTLKERHRVYLETVLLIHSDQLKAYITDENTVSRFLLRDAVETNLCNNIATIWKAGLLIDGTVDYEEQRQCETCFTGTISKPLSVNNFNIVQEWYLEIPIETQILLESFINKESIRKHKSPDSFCRKKLEKLYTVYDVLLNVHNKRFTGLFQKNNSSKLLVEYKSIGSVFDVTSTAGATSSLKQAETTLRKTSSTDVCYYNTYLKEHYLEYRTTTGELKSSVNLRSCHLILMLDNLVRLQYIADPNPGEHRSKQLCTLPITLQGLPVDSSVTEEWHLSNCDGTFSCPCKQPVRLQQSDIKQVLLEPCKNEQLKYDQFFSLMTFGNPLLWKKLPDDLLEYLDGSKICYLSKDEQNTALLDSQDDIQEESMESDDESVFLDDKNDQCESELDTDLISVLQSIDCDHPIDESETEPDIDDELEQLSLLEKSMENMSIEEEDESLENTHISLQEGLLSYGFSKNHVPPLLCRHPPPAVGRDDDISKIREILDDVLVKMGYAAAPENTINRILCGPDNKIGKCLLSLMQIDKKYKTFLPEFPLLHLRKSKINIIFSSYKEAGIIEIMKYMRNEEQDEWAKLISIQHIDKATKHVKRLALSLHLAFLISFTEYIEQEELHVFLNDMETENGEDMSIKWADKFKQYLSYGSSRNATFALHLDIMKHCDDVIAISLAERLGGKDGYGLLLAAVKGSLLFSFVNNASAYAPYCVKLLYAHYSAGYFHQCLKEELFSTPFKGSNRNFACDTKREMDHLDVLKGFRSGSNVNSVTCRMSLIDSLNATKTPKVSKGEDGKDTDKLGWDLTEVDLRHIYPTTALILRRQGLSMEECTIPYNVYSKVPLVLPSSILDTSSEGVGKYLLMRYLKKERLFNGVISDISIDECLKGPTELVNRAKRSKGITIKRTLKSKVQRVRTERQAKEEQRQKSVIKETKLIDCLSSENNACQALVKADSSKPKVMKSIGVQRALKNLLLACAPEQPLTSYMALNMTCLPQAVTSATKICTIEFAGMKFKVGHVKTGQEYLKSVEKMIMGILKQSDKTTKIVICEEKYEFTPDDFKASTREQRKGKSQGDVRHLKMGSRVLGADTFDKDILTKTATGKILISTYVAEHIQDLDIQKNVAVIVDSELFLKKDCDCIETCACPGYCTPVICHFSTDTERSLGTKELMDNVKQKKGEAEMAVSDWLVNLQPELENGDAAVCYVTSGDIDAVYIHLLVVSMYWSQDENNMYKTQFMLYSRNQVVKWIFTTSQPFLRYLKVLSKTKQLE